MQVQNIKIGSFVTAFLTPAGGEAPPESIPVASEFILAERTMHHGKKLAKPKVLIVYKDKS